MKLKRAAIKLRGLNATTEGWWYENAKSIDVYLRDRLTEKTIRGRIHRRDLEDWLRRTKAVPSESTAR